MDETARQLIEQQVLEYVGQGRVWYRPSGYMNVRGTLFPADWQEILADLKRRKVIIHGHTNRYNERRVALKLLRTV